MSSKLVGGFCRQPDVQLHGPAGHVRRDHGMYLLPGQVLPHRVCEPPRARREESQQRVFMTPGGRGGGGIMKDFHRLHNSEGKLVKAMKSILSSYFVAVQTCINLVDSNRNRLKPEPCLATIGDHWRRCSREWTWNPTERPVQS